MAVNIKVYLESSKEFLFNRIFPDSVSKQVASEIVKNYLLAEGFQEDNAIELKYYKARYTNYMLPTALKFGLSKNDLNAHLAETDEKSLCGEPIGKVFESKVKFSDTCFACAEKAGILDA